MPFSHLHPHTCTTPLSHAFHSATARDGAGIWEITRSWEDASRETPGPESACGLHPVRNLHQILTPNTQCKRPLSRLPGFRKVRSKKFKPTKLENRFGATLLLTEAPTCFHIAISDHSPSDDHAVRICCH
jgi:hypothetical protein